MKLLISLVLLLINYSLLIKGDNYVQFTYFPNDNYQCKGHLTTLTKYYPNNNNCLQDQNQSIQCSSSKGTLTVNSYSEANCTGSIMYSSTTPLNSCISDTSSNYLVNCVDDIEIPSNDALITVNSATCDWKENFNLLTILPTGQCVSTAFGTYIASCNSTSLTTKSYQYGANCQGTPFQTSFSSFDNGCAQNSNGQTTTNQCLN